LNHSNHCTLKTVHFEKKHKFTYPALIYDVSTTKFDVKPASFNVSLPLISDWPSLGYEFVPMLLFVFSFHLITI